VEDVMGERKLAVAVINTAVNDFLSQSSVRKHDKETAAEHRARILRMIRERIAAGVFLLEAVDELKLLWFTLAGIHPTRPRLNAAWMAKLTALRETETHLMRKQTRASRRFSVDYLAGKA